MAIYSGAWLYKDVEIMLWLDPNRWRVTIWGKSGRYSKIRSVKLARLWSKDKKRLVERAFDWVDDHAKELQYAIESEIKMEPGDKIKEISRDNPIVYNCLAMWRKSTIDGNNLITYEQALEQMVIMLAEQNQRQHNQLVTLLEKYPGPRPHPPITR